MFVKSFDAVQKAPTGAPRLTITTSQVVNHQAGVTRAKVTIQNGGSSGATSAGGFGLGGTGGDCAIYWVDIDPALPWTVVIGAAGVGPAAGTTSASNPGGASSITVRGLAVWNTASAIAAGMLMIPGGAAMEFTVSGGQAISGGGNSMFATPVASNTAGNGYGGGGGGANTGAVGPNGTAGLVIIEYISPGA